jgi:hypothetical protein
MSVVANYRDRGVTDVLIFAITGWRPTDNLSESGGAQNPGLYYMYETLDSWREN